MMSPTLDSSTTRTIELSEEQALLADNARSLLRKRWSFEAVRRQMATDTGFDTDLWREMGSLGWLGLSLPERYGGGGMNAGSLVYLAEPMGEHLLASPFLATTLAGQLLLRAGDENQRAHWLPRLAAGTAIGSVALSEPSGSFEPTQVEATARAAGEGYQLTGAKSFVLDALAADVVIVPARLDGALALFLVEKEQLAGRLQREVLIDETRRSARLTLDGLSLPRSAFLAGAPRSALLAGAAAEPALTAVQRLAWLLTAAEMTGGAEGVMQLTLDYLRTRRQFGKLIGGYQALKHPMVDIMIGIEHSKTLLYHAATVCDLDSAASDTALRMATLQAGETFAYAADRAIQFHGAIGFTYECHAQLFFRRAQLTQHSFGDGLHHRRHLAELLWGAAGAAG